MSGGELLQQQPAEQRRENRHREEIARATADPALAVEREAAAWHDHVDVRMVSERRAPGMEDREDADAGAEALGIGGDGEQCLGRDREQQVGPDAAAGPTTRAGTRMHLPAFREIKRNIWKDSSARKYRSRDVPEAHRLSAVAGIAAPPINPHHPIDI